mgnify:CR=1 FL=1
MCPSHYFRMVIRIMINQSRSSKELQSSTPKLLALNSIVYLGTSEMGEYISSYTYNNAMRDFLWT